MKIYKVTITKICCRGGGTGAIEYFSTQFNVFSNKQKALDYAYEQVKNHMHKHRSVSGSDNGSDNGSDTDNSNNKSKIKYNDTGCYKINSIQDEYGGYEFPELEITTTQDIMDIDSDILVSKTVSYGG
jgi:hypothetical protein